MTTEQDTRANALPTLPIGSRVQHLGSPDSFGTVAKCEPQRYAFDPCHVELTVDWDNGYRTLCGINSVKVLATPAECAECGEVALLSGINLCPPCTGRWVSSRVQS